jgi:hypothetical protein
MHVSLVGVSQIRTSGVHSMMTAKKKCLVLEPGKVPPEPAVLPPEDVRDQEFSEEWWQWREPRARGDMTNDIRQQRNILVKV